MWRSRNSGLKRSESRDLLLGELTTSLGRGLLQAQQPVVLAEQAMALHTPRTPLERDLDAAQGQLLGDPQGAMAGVGQAWSRIACSISSPTRLGCGGAGAGDPVEQPVGAIGLEVAPDLVELLAAVAHQPAGLADIAELRRRVRAG